MKFTHLVQAAQVVEVFGLTPQECLHLGLVNGGFYTTESASNILGGVNVFNNRGEIAYVRNCNYRLKGKKDSTEIVADGFLVEIVNMNSYNSIKTIVNNGEVYQASINRGNRAVINLSDGESFIVPPYFYRVVDEPINHVREREVGNHV